MRTTLSITTPDQPVPPAQPADGGLTSTFMVKNTKAKGPSVSLGVWRGRPERERVREASAKHG